MIRVYLFFIFWIFASLPLPVAATGILLSTSPEVPRDGDTVAVIATPVGDSPTLVEFIWTVDGADVASGYGVQRITTRAPALGESTLVEVTVRTGNTLIGSNTIDITPARVTLEWESNGLLPPGYNGRPLLGGQGAVRFLAVTEFVRRNGSRVPESDLVYTWKVNGKVRASESGYGKNVFFTEPPFFNNTFNVEVLVASRDTTLRATAGTVIRPVSPQVLVYETAPLSGPKLWRAITDSHEFIEEEVSFIAFPTYAGPALGSDIAWELNGKPLEFETTNTRTTVFKKTGSGSGSYRVRAAFENPFKFLDFGEQSFLLHF